MNSTVWDPVLTLPVSEARDHIDGSLDAPVTLVEYGDYECPFCGAAFRVLEVVRQQMGEQMCFVYRHFPLTTMHPHAQIAAEVAEAAGAQGMFWDMHDTLFTHQQHLDGPHLLQYAMQLQLDINRFRGDLETHAHLPKVREDFMSGIRSGVNGTPSFFINGRRHDGSWELPDLLAALQAAAGAGPRRGPQRESPRHIRP